MAFEQQIEKRAEMVDRYLKLYMEQFSTAPAPIGEAMQYSLFAGGKRIRPVLTIATYELFSNRTELVMPFACGVEMIHTYSLVHDDLPAMDDSGLRRGRPTNHMVYGEAMAVLAGDALLNAAFEVMLGTKEVDAARTLEIISLIARGSGVHGMIGGQVIDIDSEGKSIDIGLLKRLHEKKTGALIRASVLAGAICGDANEAQQSSLDAFARELGLAFQIKDDILNVEGNAVSLGKPTGNDANSGKNTYVSMLGMHRSKELLEQHTQKAKDCLVPFGKTAEFLGEFTDYLLRRNK